ESQAGAAPRPRRLVGGPRDSAHDDPAGDEDGLAPQGGVSAHQLARLGWWALIATQCQPEVVVARQRSGSSSSRNSRGPRGARPASPRPNRSSASASSQQAAAAEVEEPVVEADDAEVVEKAPVS